ncbi:MAG TPA: choice-of-anchor Q domain-containing protein [Sedimentisphaerales bacterium]|jgi:hypothetical protein|nr:choice-of-anchor Q domain-containing protein [Sedimentisphaerales bacterium]HNU29877.1 choice-of-anchor Q domain-containing protein [Sedimentisphaerales bacterium]
MNTNTRQLVIKTTTALLLAWAASTQAAVRYVALDGSGTNGQSWATAYTDIQTAINDAAVADGDEIRIKQGRYKIDWAIQVDKAVKILGGYRGESATRDAHVYATTIDGGGMAWHVFSITANATIDGLTITGGRAFYNHEIDGGGMLITNCSATVTNCTFVANSCQRRGGGIALSAAHGTVIADCTFTENVAGTHGGGIYNYDSDSAINHCAFVRNEANTDAEGYGGGIMNAQGAPSITGCTFTGNVAFSGAGLCNSLTHALVESCTFADCGPATTCGGGIYNTGGSPTISKCLFQNNAVTHWGGAILDEYSGATVIDCIMWANSAGIHGGAVYIGETETLSATYPQLVNCTLYGNKANRGGALYSYGGAATLWNCILWGNKAFLSGPGIYNNTQAFTATTLAYYSNIEGDSVYSGLGNLCVDPLLKDPERGNFQLLSGSPCIDAGSHATSVETLDYEGNARVVDGDNNGAAVVDLGALEYQKSAETDHPYRGEILQTIAYDSPSDTSATYVFSLLLETNDSVYRIEFRTPNSGNTYLIPNDSQTSSKGVTTSHLIRNGRHVWRYRAELDTPAALAGYGNGTYRITLYYRGTSEHSIQVPFMMPKSNATLAQPTQRPVIVSPASGGAMGSPVTVRWDTCTDASANTVSLAITDSATAKEVVTETFDLTALASGAYGLPEGGYRVACAFANVREVTASDETPFTCGKAIAVSQAFEVPYSAVYRFWSAERGYHFYTASESEKNWLVENYAYLWTFEGPVFNAWSTPYHERLLPVYRFWSGHSHFYTISEDERNLLLKDYADVWDDEGIAYYAYPEGAQTADCVPVYRLWKAENNTHFYTASEADRNFVIKEYGHIYTDEGVVFYTHP